MHVHAHMHATCAAGCKISLQVVHTIPALRHACPPIAHSCPALVHTCSWTCPQTCLLTSATKTAFLNQVSMLITPLLVYASGHEVRFVEWLACGLGLLGSGERRGMDLKSLVFGGCLRNRSGWRVGWRCQGQVEEWM
eukprot:1160390-Pelagomonas_calceolata.AAC.13